MKVYRYFGREYFVSLANYVIITIHKISSLAANSGSPRIKAISFYKISLNVDLLVERVIYF